MSSSYNNQPANSETYNAPYPPPETIESVENVKSHLGKTLLLSAETAISLFDLSPANDLLKYSVMFATDGVSHNALLAAGAYSAATIAIESISSLAAAPLLETKYGAMIPEKIVSISDKLNKFPRTQRLIRSVFNEDGGIKSTSVQRGIAATYTGAVGAMALKKFEKPERNETYIRRYGLKTSLWLGGLCFAEGGLLTSGVNLSVDNPKISIPAILSVGAAYIGKKLQNKHSINKELHERSYNLSSEELAELESALVEKSKNALKGDEGIAAIWINSKSKYANLLRIHESNYFPEVKDVVETEDDDIVFLALVDTRDGNEKVIHGAQVTGISYDPVKKKFTQRKNKDQTGMYTIDSLINLGNMSKEQVASYYNARNINLDHCIAVETNFRINKAPRFKGLSPAELAYLMCFRLVNRVPGNLDEKVVFASVNKVTRISFKMTGLECEPLMGRKDWITEESFLGKESQPVAIPYNQSVINILEKANKEITIPELCI